MHLTLRHLELVRAIANGGTLTAAAKQLNLTQPALSHRLKDLEQKAGMAVFLKTKKGFVLNDAGQELLEAADHTFQRLKQAEQTLLNLRGGKTGTIWLAVQCYTCFYWVSPVLQKFHAAFPEINVEFNTEATGAALDALKAGEIDIAITRHPWDGDKEIHTHPLFTDEIVALVAPRHRLANKPFAKPDDLSKETIFLHEAHSSQFIRSVFAQARTFPAKLRQVKLTEVSIELAKAGAGIALLPKWVVRLEIKCGTLIPLRIGRRGITRTWFAHTRPHLENRAAVIKLLDLLAGAVLKE